MLAERERKWACNNILLELRLDNQENYRRYLGNNTDTFDELKCLVARLIQEKTTRFRKPIAVAEKLDFTQRFSATGQSYSSLQYQFRTTQSTNSVFIPNVCSPIYVALKDIYLQYPKKSYFSFRLPSSTLAISHLFTFNFTLKLVYI